MQHVYIVGAKGIGQYGGYETFVNKLIDYSEGSIQYHVACKANGEGHMDVKKLDNLEFVDESTFRYNGAEGYLIKVPNIGSAQAIVYDCRALRRCLREIRDNHIENPIVYILACRIGPVLKGYVRKIHKLGGKVYINPDGHEWMRGKWNALVRCYWKISEDLMVKNADLVVCDSKNIEKYIKKCYRRYNPVTTYIAYGAEIEESNADIGDWLARNDVNPKGYYLVVGRFVPENNYEVMIREFMKSSVDKDFLLITKTHEEFLDELEKKLHYRADKRIKFVGTVYNQPMLKKIREEAYGYLHGHEVGGTNPSLLEALGSTQLNLVLNVGFNTEVGEDAALYWNKEEDNLKELLEKCEYIDREILGEKAKNRIRNAYSWQFICDEYKKLFCGGQ